MASSLDIPERQLLIYFSADRVPWHARILLERISGARWVLATPTLDVEVTDLDEAEDFVPVGRLEPLPEACRPVFAFEQLSAGEIQDLRAQARRMADILGVPSDGDPADGEAQWLFADTSHERFSEVVGPGAMAGGRSLLRGSSGLLEEPEGGDESWTFIERVKPSDKAEWIQAKRTGAGRDPRLNEVGVGDSAGRILLGDALSTMRKKDMPNWPFRGPSAVAEVLSAIRSTGMEPPAYLAHYISTSGMTQGGGLANELRILVTQLWYMVSIDGLDATNLASAELLARRLLQMQRAIRRSPRSPDFTGLEAFTESALDVHGHLTAREFDKYMMEVQKTEAQIMKNQRMTVEEAETARKKANTKGGGSSSSAGAG